MSNYVETIAVGSTVAFILYIVVMQFVSAGDDSGHIDHGHHVGGGDAAWLQFLSIQLLLIAIMGYSWGWLYWSQRLPASAFLAGVATFITGSALVTLKFYLGKLMIKLNTPAVTPVVPEYGMTGKLYTGIKAGDGEMGIANLKHPVRGQFEVTAYSLSQQELVAGQDIVVYEVLSDTAVRVGAQ